MDNEKVIGIPRAMSFYNNYPFYYGFFTDLGIKIVLSDVTTKQTMSSGSALVVSETCLPIKVYVGHILNLLEKGVDKIFIPSIQSIDHKIYNCSKIRGLPDLIKNVVKQNFTIIDATLDKSAKNQGLYAFLKEAVALEIKKVYLAGFDGYSKRGDNYFDVSREYSFAKEKADYFNEYVKEFLNTVKDKLIIKFITKSKYNKI